MKLEDYPAQEPLSEAGEIYSKECFARSAGIVYDEHRYGPDPYQGIAVYRAAKPNGTILIAWNGGGWTSGYKEWMGFMAPALNAAGVTLVSPGYRLAPGHTFPAGPDDCMAAVKWVHEHAAGFGGERSKIFLGGHSAGGHYCSLLAVRRDWQAALGLPGDVVRGCLPISGVYDFMEGALPQRPRFLGDAAANPDSDRKASPIRNLQSPLPPFLIAYGSEDFPHLMKQADQFGDALVAAGGRSERVVLPGRNHFGACYAGGEADGPWVPRALDFLGKNAG
ncbi:MAG: alpha/beta hydrolase [Betaproteobacteria bacterium]|nr:alpha/beta hydrolase [Betaproteobacteria bacterium]